VHRGSRSTGPQSYYYVPKGEKSSNISRIKRLGLIFRSRVCRSGTLSQSTQQNIHANLTARASCSVQQKGPSDSQHGFSSLEAGNLKRQSLLTQLMTSAIVS
jgi:hypothetical protein